MTLPLWEFSVAVVLPDAPSSLRSPVDSSKDGTRSTGLHLHRVPGEIVATSTPAGWAKTRSSLLNVRPAAALFCIYGLGAGLLVLAMLEHWSNDTRGAVAACAFSDSYWQTASSTRAAGRPSTASAVAAPRSALRHAAGASESRRARQWLAVPTGEATSTTSRGASAARVERPRMEGSSQSGEKDQG